MRVLLIRHGTAEDAGYRDGRPVTDENRELTKEGRGEIKQVGLVLSRIVPKVDKIAASPLARAAQTAEIISRNYTSGPVEELKALIPHGSVFAVLSWLEQQDPSSSIALVGHEPSIGLLTGWLVCGEERTPVHFSKGSACCVEFAGCPTPGGGTIRWMLTRKIAALLCDKI